MFNKPKEILMNVPMRVSVELGRVELAVKDVLDLDTGSVVPLHRSVTELVDLRINDKIFARGKVVTIENKFGLRIENIITPVERLTGLVR
ncbi:MAG: FliM/FliN family flagellar motor switch protein [bacterium]|nr:FliM/FliN family flagellar motor switch protein [bacterium]